MSVSSLRQRRVRPLRTRFPFTRPSATLLAALLLGGCASITPEPLTSTEIVATSAADRQAAQDIEPLTGALSLEEAIARALKYNLERRTRLMEEAIATGQLDVGNYDLLPKLVASAGYRDRSNYLITNSIDSVTGQPSLANPYVSSARSATTTDLTLSWSLLDFGQSYYASRQNADRLLIAGERRRKAMHILVQDVRTLFWRVACAQKLRTQIQATVAAAEDVLIDARRAEAERLRNPLEALRYQRQLLENLRLLETIDQELSTSRLELAALTNLPLVQNITVVEPASVVDARWQAIPVEAMEEQAIANNADLRESFYNARIAREETRRALLKLFPGLTFNYGPNHSDDPYLINQRWTAAGVQLSFNLLNLFSAPAQMKLADAGVALADQKRMATQMAVLTQLHVARLNYANAVHQYERADTIWKVDREIASHVARREQAQTQTKLDRVAHETAAILSELRRYQALSQVNTATSRLQATLGLEPAIEATADQPLAELTAAVGDSLKAWNAGQQEKAKAE